MKVELTRFHVIPGKSERVDAWMRMLNERMSETLVTLDREQMYLEVIFREKIGEDEYLYWFSVQGEEGGPLETSPHEIDRLHMEFGKECIDTSYGAYEAMPQVVMVPERIAAAMGWRNPEKAAVEWEGRQSHRQIGQPAAPPDAQ